MIHHDHPVREALDVGELVGGQEDRPARRPEVGDERADDRLRLRVHACRRLVENQELRAPDERERERETLLLAAREQLVAPAPREGQPKQVQQMVGVDRVRVEAGVEPEQLAGPSLRRDAATLEHQANPGVERCPVADRIQPEDAHGAAIRSAVPLEDLHGGRLPGAVRAEQRDELATGYREVEAVEDLERPITFLEPAHFDREGHAARVHAVPAAVGPVPVRLFVVRMGDQGVRGDGHARIAARMASSSAASRTCPIWMSRTIPARSMK